MHGESNFGSGWTVSFKFQFRFSLSSLNKNPPIGENKKYKEREGFQWRVRERFNYYLDIYFGYFLFFLVWLLKAMEHTIVQIFFLFSFAILGYYLESKFLFFFLSSCMFKKNTHYLLTFLWADPIGEIFLSFTVY